MFSYLKKYPLLTSGKTTFKEEFVTCGGISLENINPSKNTASVRRTYNTKERFYYLSFSYFNFDFVIKELRNSKERIVDVLEDFFYEFD